MNIYWNSIRSVLNIYWIVDNQWQKKDLKTFQSNHFFEEGWNRDGFFQRPSFAAGPAACGHCYGPTPKWIGFEAHGDPEMDAMSPTGWGSGWGPQDSVENRDIFAAELPSGYLT